MWLYYLLLRSFGVRGFEMESIAFFLSTLSLAVTASSAPGSVFKQFVAIVLGPVVHAGAGRGAAGRRRIQKLRWLMAALAIGLLGITLVAGQTKYGAANWIYLGPISFQPSKLPRSAISLPARRGWSGCFASATWGCSFLLTGACLVCLR